MGVVQITTCDRCHDVVATGAYHITAPWDEYYFCAKCTEEFKAWVQEKHFMLDVPD